MTVDIDTYIITGGAMFFAGVLVGILCIASFMSVAKQEEHDTEDNQ